MSKPRLVPFIPDAPLKSPQPLAMADAGEASALSDDSCQHLSDDTTPDIEIARHFGFATIATRGP